MAFARRNLNMLKVDKAKGDGTNEELSVELVNLMNQKTETEKRYAQTSIKYTELKSAQGE